MLASVQTLPKTRPARRYPLAVWRDPAGRLSALRIVALLFLLTPVAIAVCDWNAVGFGARPLNDVIHRTGYWTLIFLLTSLAITPLRRIARFGQLLDVRRMIGVGAFIYAATHISLFIADQKYDLFKVASEIVLRLYLTIGFVALLGLAVLALTSTDGMVRRLGAKRWQRLHQAIYGIALLALIHYFQQTKADVSVPTFTAALFAWMIGYRIIVKAKKSRGEPATWVLLALTIVVSALTFVAEAAGIAIVFNTSPWMVLQTTLEFDLDMIRPGWLVLAAGLCVVAVGFVRALFAKPRRRAPPGGLSAAVSQPPQPG